MLERPEKKKTSMERGWLNEFKQSETRNEGKKL